MYNLANNIYQNVSSAATSCFNFLKAGYDSVTSGIYSLAPSAFANLRALGEGIQRRCSSCFKPIKSGYDKVSTAAGNALFGTPLDRNAKRLQAELLHKNPEIIFVPVTKEEIDYFELTYYGQEINQIRELLKAVLPDTVTNKLFSSIREAPTRYTLNWNAFRILDTYKLFPVRERIELVSQLLWVKGSELNMPKFQAAAMDILYLEYLLHGDGDGSSLTSDKNNRRLLDLIAKGFLSENLVTNAISRYQPRSGD